MGSEGDYAWLASEGALCIGSVYAWSIYNPALIRVFGVVTPAAEDWLLSDVDWIFTVAIVFLGLAAGLSVRR